jgi:drug/metabolite transporter (DMT)-like permease
MRLRADLALFLVAILWGSAFAAQRVAGGLGSVYFFNGARFLLAALLLAPLALKAGTTRGQWFWMIAAGGVLFTASALQQAGMVYTTAGNAGFITSLYVVLVPFVIWVGWKERPTGWAVPAAVLATLGTFLLSAQGRFYLQPGDALELAGAVIWAFHVVLLGRFATRFHPVSFTAGQLLVGGLLNFGMAGAFERLPIPVPPPLVAATVYTAVFSLGIGYSLQVWGQRHTPPSEAAIILSLEAVFAVLAGWALLNETLTWIQAGGCLLIIMALGLTQIRRWGKIPSPISTGDSGATFSRPTTSRSTGWRALPNQASDPARG